MKRRLNNLLTKVSGLRVVNNDSYQKLIAKDKSGAYELLQIMQETRSSYEITDLFVERKSQLLQDLFVVLKSNFKRNGFFVEFGATNGVSLSNTYLLEKRLNWSGILVEPCKKFHEDLKRNRNSIIDIRCVYERSGEKILFSEVDDLVLSTISNYSDEDSHKKSRKNNKTYEVETISLEDLLEFYDSPRVIDYLSIDTEGSEYDILKNFNYDKYKFNIITVEHNYTKKREQIKKLLESKGYKRIFENVSKWDDWYIS